MAVTFRDPDTLNETPVSAATPLPVQGIGATGAGTNTIGNVFMASEYPAGATPVKSAVTVANAIATASLPAVSNVTNFVKLVVISGYATAATTVAVTITGPTGGTMTIQVPIGTLAAPSAPTRIEFPFGFPASAQSTAITLTVPAAGAGAVVSAFILGYTL